MNPNGLTEALKDPVPTHLKNALAFEKRVPWGQLAEMERPKRGQRWLPPLDGAALSRKYGMARAYAPRLHQGVFKMPKDATQVQVEKIIEAATEKFVKRMETTGWRLVAPRMGWRHLPPNVLAKSKFFVLLAGRDPAPDLATGGFDGNAREFVIAAFFRKVDPKPVRVEVDPRMTGARRI